MHMLQKMHALNVRRPSASAAAYTANAVQFDGVNDWLSKASAISAATSSQGTFLVHLNPAAVPIVAPQFIMDLFVGFDNVGGNAVAIFIQGDGTGYYIGVQLFKGALKLTFYSDYFTPNDGFWKWLGISWDTNFSAGNKLCHMYLGNTDVLDLPSVHDEDSAFSIDYSAITEPHIGYDNLAPYERYNGGMAELYFSTEYNNLADPTVRQRAISTLGKPVSMGTNGSLLSGNVPALYLKGNSTGFHINSGSGGNLSLTGALTAAATSPSD